MKRLSDLQSDSSQKKQKTSSSRVEVSTNGEKRISDEISITTNSTCWNFMNVCTIPEVLDCLVKIPVHSILILGCTNKFFNESIFKMTLSHLMKLYEVEDRRDLLTKGIFKFNETIFDSVRFYICALKTLQNKANSSAESEQIYGPCEQFVKKFDEDFNKSFDACFEANFGADAMNIKWTLNGLLDKKRNPTEGENIFYTEFAKTFIVRKFVGRFLNADRSLNTNLLASSLRKNYLVADLIPLVIQFNGIRTGTNQLNDLLIRAIQLETNIDLFCLINTLVNYKSPECNGYLTIDVLKSTIQLLTKIHSDTTKSNHHSEAIILHSFCYLYEILETIISSINQKDALDENALNSLLNAKQCCFNLLEILSNSAEQGWPKLLKMILNIFSYIVKQSNGCTEKEFLFLGQIFKNLFNQYNSDFDLNSILALLDKFLDIFAYVNFTEPDHIKEYVSMSNNFVCEIFRRPLTTLFFNRCYRIIHALLKYRSFLKAEDFKDLKNEMLTKISFDHSVSFERSDYSSFLSLLIENGLITIDVEDFAKITNQILNIKSFRLLPQSIPHLIIGLLCNQPNFIHFDSLIPVIMATLKPEDYGYLKNELMSKLKYDSVHVNKDKMTSLLLTIHNKKPILDKSELEFLLPKPTISNHQLMDSFFTGQNDYNGYMW